ncbi:AP-4 complex subunit sigma [Trypanosoma theileri]|uniref:AP complex subunit sigma n=1 Tax=Trypanosoma theileri TaxID=67003 RepID=A0A1X0P6L4_9TRYP|nr:AP-4 complex subunit sigma [Trypanosoma theileri]ORC92577.1 AP-4 complex subunit sigma [Trypanosoma theileri]
MAIEFILLVNKQGQTRLAQYSSFLPIVERTALEGEVVRKCLQRRDVDCNFLEHLRYKLVYRRYASLFFIVGVNNKRAAPAALQAPTTTTTGIAGVPISNSTTPTAAAAAVTTTSGGGGGGGGGETDAGEDILQEGELAIFEFIHLLVETFDRYFENVCELDVMFNVEKAHFILEEMLVNGGIGETNKMLILQSLVLMDKEPRKV